MSKPGEILIDSRQSRIQLFLDKLKPRLDEFRNTVIDGTLCKIPLTNQIPNKRYWQFRIKLPIGYESNTRYRIRMHGTIYDLYKYNNNFYLIDIPTNVQPNITLYNSFRSTIQFSFLYMLIDTLLKELISNYVTVDIDDKVFTGLLDHYHTKNGQLKVILTPFSVKNKVMDKDRLYISVFN